jgi:hypothetical protein
MNRVLRRPMFRTGGSAEGLTSGLAPRQGYADPAGLVEQLQAKKSIIDTLAPRTPRKDTSMRDFLINFGLDIASRPPQGSIFSTAAASAKEPFAKFQEAKQIQEAYGMKETDEDRALVADLIKGMDDDKLSALMKDVKAGVESGLFANEKEGINQLLKKKIYGVQDMPGEADTRRINNLEDKVWRADPKSFGYARKVAEHILKMEKGEYEENIQNELNQSKIYIKPRHWAGTVKDEDGEVVEIVIKAGNNYPKGIYFEPMSGNLFKMVGKEGEAPRFVKVIPD